MIVSWNWLKDYVRFDGPAEEVSRRLALAGLNHEGTTSVGSDLAIDLEITSNRPDCMSHLGIAREISVLFQLPLTIADPQPAASASDASQVVQVQVACPELCARYTARVIRGVKIGPSPAWLVSRLATVNVKSVNNVVDTTNYVLLECGQPLHAFDLARLRGQRIIVRQPLPGEQLVAIDHKAYSLESGMCVIADGERAVAVGGIMGGYDSEVSHATRDLLIEAAEFAPLAIRNAARKLKLRSPSSDRFERGVDPERLDWASRRCCELILELAGGELCSGVVDVAQPRTERTPITLRLAQLPRILGIAVSPDEVRRILTALGCQEQSFASAVLTTQPPSWRRDLTREIDLVEEVARIHGYEQIPEDVGVPMFPSHRTDADRIFAKTRQVLTGAGFDEALTSSAVSADWAEAFSPWTSVEPLRCQTPVIKGADCLRRSLLPSLLSIRALNEAAGNDEIELFELAKVYLPQGGELPAEPCMVGLSSGRPYHEVKGVIEGMLAVMHCTLPLRISELRHAFFKAGTGCELKLGDATFGYLGQTSTAAQRTFGLRQSSVVAEWNLEVLQQCAVLVPKYQPVSAYPAISQDLNVIVAESLRWADLSATVQTAAGELLERIEYRETYRDPKTDGPGKKRILFSTSVRSSTGTLTTEQANAVRDRIVQAIAAQHDGRLLG